MTNIISIDNIYLDLVDPDGTSHWIAVANIADMVQTIPATYHPADSAHPAEYGPALCSAGFMLEPNECPPPVHGTEHDKIQYIHQLDLDWELDID